MIADLIAVASCDPSGVAALALAHRKAAATSTKLRLVAPSACRAKRAWESASAQRREADQ